MFREPLCVNRRRLNNELQIPPFGQNPFDISEQKINVERPLVRLVNYQDGIFFQKTVVLDFRQQNPVRHELDFRVRRRPVVKSDFISNQIGRQRLTSSAKRVRKLFRNASGDADSGDAPRLSMTDNAMFSQTHFQKNFRNLRRFP